MLQGRGQIIESDEIRFDQVPLISPNGDVLVKSMSFNVEKGVSWRYETRHQADEKKHLLVVGPNGCESIRTYVDVNTDTKAVNPVCSES